MSKDKIKKFGDLAYEYIRKQLIKPSKDGITSLPTDKEITNEMLQMFEKLRGAGYNVTNIGKEVKNAEDLKFLVNRIDQAEINQAKEFSDASEALETIQFKLNNNIPLNPEDQKKLLGKGFKTASEAFQGFKPKLIQGGKKEGIEQLLEEGKITKGTAPKTKKTKPPVDTELQKSEDLKKEFKDFEDRNPDEKAMGGRIGMVRGGGILKFLSENNPLQAYRKYLKSVKERAQKDPGKLFPELAALTSGGIFVNRRMKNILEQGNEQQKERFLKEFKEDIDKAPFYKDRPELKDKAIENYTETLFGEKRAMGGRIGFKEGGGMTRRTFLKLLGGIASIPFVGKFFKPAAKASKAVEVASKSADVPSYFPKLVEKIKLLGDDFTKTAATKERQVVTKYKDYELTEDLTTGELRIKRDNYTSEEYLQFEPAGQYHDETRKKVIKYPEQYEEVTVKPDYEGKMKDVDYGLDNIDEIKREVGETEIKKSGGGLAYMMGE